MGKKQLDGRQNRWRLWFHLTHDERKLVVFILALFLVGLTARYIHLRQQQPDPVEPPPRATERFQR